MTPKTDIYFVDFSHTGTIVSANYFPLGIGYVAAYLSNELSDQVQVRLFKYPEDLSASLKEKMPRIMGFSNYSWNINLSYEYIKQIKARYPETVIVMGGPNYGFSEEELKDFWDRYPLIDFYIVFEGELAIVKLVDTLISNNFDVKATKSDSIKIPNCHYIFENVLIKSEPLPRIKDLNSLPSPYLMGLMDKFFDGILIPLVSTTRGCPFKCTFCSEGNSYYNKVAKRYDLEDELSYIAERVGSIKDLCLTDANFGMFSEDLEKAQIIAQIQNKFDWPRRMSVSTGKNQKVRVLKVASLLNGAMYVGGAMQTTDPEILKNIKRSNISLEELGTKEGDNDKEMDSYTELILALPGDNVKAHTKSLRDMVETGVDGIRMYQLIMLPQTEMGAMETRKKYGMQTKYRLMPRSFGPYELWGKKFSAVEYEEICVANSTLSFKDYLNCRELDLSIEILNNGKFFKELIGLCNQVGISWFDIIIGFHNRRKDFSPGLERLYDSFRIESDEGYWATPDELEKTVKERINEYLHNEEGTNEMAKGKTRAVFRLIEDLHDLLFETMKEELKKSQLLDETMAQYLEELKTLSLLRKGNLLDTEMVHEVPFNFDFQAIDEKEYIVDPSQYKFDQPVMFVFKHSDDQQDIINSYLTQYGDSLDGLGRILMRAQYKHLIREVTRCNADLPVISA